MEYDDLIRRFSHSTEQRQKAIFSTLFIVGNRLQTIFDSRIPEVSLKQFMLLSIVRQAEGPMSLTQLGRFLGCSRQNVKKLAAALEKKGFVTLRQSPRDARVFCVSPAPRAERFFQQEFAQYQAELGYLFEVYTPEEIQTLFALLTRLYAGIEHLERKVNHVPDQTQMDAAAGGAAPAGGRRPWRGCRGRRCVRPGRWRLKRRTSPGWRTASTRASGASRRSRPGWK